MAGHGGPAFAVDISNARIVAANAAGLSSLDLAPSTRLPLALDGAMPAISRLRQIAAAGADKGGSELLTFWIDGRLTRLNCNTRTIDGPGSSLVLLTPGEALATLTHDTLTPVATSAGAPDPVAPERVASEPVTPEPVTPEPVALVEADSPQPPVQRDDAQTLKEIARAIREGRLQHAPLNAREETGNSAVVVSEPVPLPLKTSEAPLDAAYLAKLAHELKTPLSAIVAAAEIMRDERLGPMGNRRYLGYSGDIHESASHALDVINRMLGGANGKDSSEDGGEKDHDPSRFKPVDLNSLCEKTVSVVQPLAAARGLTLALNLEDHLPSVLADPTAVRQILLNLVTNALKFTPRNGDVRVVTGYLDNGAVFLVVRDTGAGMDAQALANIMEAGAEHAYRRRPGGGYGMGFPLVRALVEANNAELEIDSAPGRGTVVLIAFPRDRIVQS